MDALIAKYGFKEGLTTVDGVIKEWPYEEPQPTSEELAEIIKDYNKKTLYRSLRKAEYGSIEDQLDYIVKNGVEAYRDRNQAIKRKYPKPE